MAMDTNAVWNDVRAAWVTGETEGIRRRLAEDVSYHMPPVGDFDRESLVAFIGGFRQAFPDFDVTLDDTVADGDRVAWLWHCSGTFSGESPVVPVPPTGKRSEASGTIVARFRDGMATEVWHHGDWLSWLQVPLG